MLLAYLLRLPCSNSNVRAPKLNTFYRLFWTTLRRVWSRWTGVLVIVKSETVICWHRAGSRLY